MSRYFQQVAFLLIVLSLTGCGLVVEAVDRLVNTVDQAGVRPDPLEDAKHQRLFVADLHADTLLWERNMLVRSDYGHVDLPRLKIGNVSLQVFTVATNSGPAGTVDDARKWCHTADGVNLITILTALEGRRVDSWSDLETRALDQADRLKRFEQESQFGPSGAQLRIVRTKADLAEVVEAWRGDRRLIGGILGLEGVHWLGDVRSVAEAEAGVERLFNAGFRQLALTHQFDNGLAGASEGCNRTGLTPLGEVVLDKAERLGMVIDLAHLSSDALREAAKRLSKPVVVSHAGVKEGCTKPCNPDRNLSKEDIWAIAKNGGVIGIGYWHEAVGDEGKKSVVDAIERVVYTISVLSSPPFVAAQKRVSPDYDPYDHVAFGSDFDGVVKSAIDSSQLAMLTGELRRRRRLHGAVFTEERIRKIAGANVCRVYAAQLPSGIGGAPRDICYATMRGRAIARRP
jgi:membrane dipeptidase